MPDQPSTSSETPPTTTPETASSDTPATPAPAASPAPSEGEGKKVDGTSEEQFLFAEKKSVDNPDGGNAADGKGEGDKKEGEKESEKAAPIEYGEFALPEGMELNKELDTTFKEFAQTAKLSKDQAQQLVDLYVKQLTDQQETFLNTVSDWKKEIENHPEIGGKNLEATQGRVNDLVRNHVSSPEHFEEVKGILVNFGLGNSRPVVELLNNIAMKLADDKLDGPGAAGDKSNLSPEDRLWPNMKR